MAGPWRQEQKTECFPYCGDGTVTTEAACFFLFCFFFFVFLTRLNHGAADTKLQFTRRLASASAAHQERRHRNNLSFRAREFLRGFCSRPLPPDEPTVWGRRPNLNPADTAAGLLSPALLCLKRRTVAIKSCCNFPSAGENPEGSWNITSCTGLNLN